MNRNEKDEQMDRVPSDVIYGLTLDGKGGMQPLAAGSEIPGDKPGWLHLDYGNPEAARWLLQTPLLNDAARESLLGQSNRPKLVRMGETVLLILRGINHNKDHRPEEMVALRIYITPDLIISSRRRALLSEQDVYGQLKLGGGADTPADWLVEICDALTDRAGEFVEELHDQILDLEEMVLMRDLPANGRLALIRKQLIMIRRYLSPQRDLVARLANEKISWLDEDDRRRLLDIADRLRRWLDDLDAGVARTAVLADEINNLMAEATNRRAYQMSVMALLFLPASFLTGLFGINLGGIPGAESPTAFWVFCGSLVALATGLAVWLKHRRWW
ncbi:zinc transporter ZntB [Aeromonas bestiarum]|jgi:zinc transporter|uniref:Zinc transporter ZntB n=2 Tax=Gammaproteobacteria TaxID=1236 RepID=A0AAW7HVN9_9GAMM|nr:MULTISPECIES: zinc transporter ZntB [Aeromonas]ATL97450.1 zinc transporter ZntB [Aeromonas sp. CA23]EKP0277664.1 zinc transporter ZntB [Aeromonas bestiarum]MDM5074137.1 zinc transporter ZntB [Aeromonas bestiarum]MDM5090505.1 zinc transporter ZntB [Aeromonas bestiarum]MDM5139869.1 zinc transporter ZntB [Aeromonas bestiarum]